MRELRSGLWHWEAPHPQWRPTEPWSENVSSYAIDDGERLLLGYAAAATDALLVRVALSSRLACSCRSEPAGGRGRLRRESRDRLPLVASLPEGGWSALAERRPVPKRQPRRLSRELEQRILAARELAKAGPLIVAAQLGLPASTVWKVLRRHGVSRLQLPAREPVRRYERARPGELLHVDIKKLGRFWMLGKRVLGSEVGNRSRRAGWQYLHLAIDDPLASRLRRTARKRASRRMCRLPPARRRLVRRTRDHD